MTMELRCNTCGHTQPDGGYCEQCGRPLRPCPQPTESEYSPVQLDTVPALANVPSSTRWRRKRRIIVGGLAALVILIALGLVAAHLSGSDTVAKAPNATTTHIESRDATPESLAPIQPPPRLSREDFFSVQSIARSSQTIASHVARLSDLVGRYPAWNTQDERVFPSSCDILVHIASTDRNTALHGENAIQPSAEFEAKYDFWGKWHQSLAGFGEAAAMFKAALASSDAETWRQATELLNAAAGEFAAAVDVANALYEYGNAGNVDWQ